MYTRVCLLALVTCTSEMLYSVLFQSHFRASFLVVLLRLCVSDALCFQLSKSRFCHVASVTLLVRSPSDILTHSSGPWEARVDNGNRMNHPAGLQAPLACYGKREPVSFIMALELNKQAIAYLSLSPLNPEVSSRHIVSGHNDVSCRHRFLWFLLDFL